MIGSRIKIHDDPVEVYYGTIIEKTKYDRWVVRWDNYGKAWFWGDTHMTLEEITPYILEN